MCTSFSFLFLFLQLENAETLRKAAEDIALVGGKRGVEVCGGRCREAEQLQQQVEILKNQPLIKLTI